MLYVTFISVPAGAQEALSDLSLFKLENKITGFEKLNTPQLRVGSLDQCLCTAERLEILRKELEQNVTHVKSSLTELVSSLRLQREGEHIQMLSDICNQISINNELLLAFTKSGGTKDLDAQLETLTSELHNSFGNLQDLLQNISEIVKTMAELRGMIRGPLTTCLLSDLIPKSALLEKSSCLRSLVFVVPVPKLGEWRETYETLTPFIVPTSAREITTDDKNFQLVTVVVFSKFASEYIEAAKARGFVHRPLSEVAESRTELIQRERDLMISFDRLISRVGFEFHSYLCKAVETNFLTLYAETVLRFGLPSSVETFYLITNSRENYLAVRRFLDSSSFTTEGDRYPRAIDRPIIVEFLAG